jgi:hypothetical protein
LVTEIVHAAFPTRVTNRLQDCTHLDRIPIGNHSEHPFQRLDFERCLKSSVPAPIMVTASGVSVLITSDVWLKAANQMNPLFPTPLRVIKSGKRIGGCRLEPDHFFKRHGDAGHQEAGPGGRMSLFPAGQRQCARSSKGADASAAKIAC